jgi:2-succinyl-5-enolpyruvyl-6-hydroxy-3-cyclohexene-1-carboxylate synthase
MGAQPSFTEAIRAVASGLREHAHSHVYLNRASSGIDHLGRQLHGLGYARDREIAGCLTAALGELSVSHGLAEEERAEAVQRVISHLDAALVYAGAGVISTAP